MKTFAIFCWKLGYLVFATAEQLSVNLQAKDTTTVGEGRKGALKNGLIILALAHCASSLNTRIP